MYVKKTYLTLLVVLICSSAWAQNAPRQIRNLEDSRQLDREQLELHRQMMELSVRNQRELAEKSAAKKEEEKRLETIRTTGCNPRTQRCDPPPAQRSVRQAPRPQAPAPGYDPTTTPSATPSDQIKFRRTN